MKKIIPLIICLFLGTLFNIYAQKGATKPTNSIPHLQSSPGCPLAVSIQDNIPAAVCSELLKTLVAVTGTCTDTTAVRYRWSSNIGGVFSTSRTTTFNLPEFFITTPITFTVWVVEGSDSLSANYTINVKPRPNSPTLTPFGTIVLCDNNPVTLTSSACTGGSTTVWSSGASGVSSINVPAIGGTYFSVACYKNGCISDSTAAAALIAGIVSSPPTTTNKVICEGTTITAGNGLQANLVNCNNGVAGTYVYTGGTVGYDDGYINNGGVNPTVSIPTTSGIIKKVSISITWRKQKGGFQNDCGVGDTQTWPYHNETQFRVKSPSGKIITLVNTNTYGGSNNPTVTTVFEDGASPVNFYSPPVSGTFAPSQPLSGFIGENPTVTWTLLPYDAVWKDPLCVSGFSVTFSDAQNGNLTWWDAPTGGNQVGTGSEYIPTATTAGTYTYYAQAQCVKGCPSVRTATTLTIQPTPLAPTISVSIPEVNSVRSICSGESITLTATGCGGTVRWNSSYNGTNFASGASYTFTPSGGNSINVTHTFTAACEGTNLCRSANSASLSVVVKYKPNQPTISGPGTSICASSSITLSAFGCSGGTLGWTSNRSGNSISFNLMSTVSIKTACTINGCTSDSSSVYTITPLPKPSTLTVNASQVQALCYGSSVTLTASACVGTIKWTGNLSGSPLTVTPLSSKNYKASCLSPNGCSSDSSTALNIIVLSKTKPVITGNSFVCGVTFNTLIATGCSGANETVVWRNDSIGTNYSETINQTKTFRAVCIRNGYCVSDSSDIFTVQYRIKPSQPTITPPAITTICQGISVSLTATACTGGISNWTGGLTGQTINVSPNTSKSYKVACVINGCVSDSSLAVSLTVNPSPLISVNSNKTSICSGDSAFLTVTGCTGTISWSNGATTSIIKVSPTSNTTYTSTCTLGSCSATQSLSIILLSTPYVTTSGLLQCGQSVTLTANNVPVGSSIQWRKDGVDIANATNGTLVINSAGSYDFTSYKVESSNINNIGSSIEDLYFINSQVGFLASPNGIYKTINGGTSWVQVQSLSFQSITFINSNIGWAVINDGTNGKIAKTIDGGNTWSITTVTNYTPFKIIRFRDANNGVILSKDFSTVYYTDNGGITWSLASGTNIAYSYKSVAFVPNTSIIYMLGFKSTNVLAKSTDNGVSWSQIPIDVFRVTNEITFSSTNNGWITCDDGFFLKTTDGGNTWIAQSSGFSGRTLFKIQFVDSQNGFTTGKLLKTNNGGQSWQAIDAPGFSYGLYFIDKNTGWWSYISSLSKYTTPQCPTTPAVIAPPQRQNAPTITPPSNSTICQGSNITLSATGCTGGTFAWTGGLTGTSITVSPSMTKAYKVACTLNTCVSDSSSAVSITVNSSSIFSLNSNKNSICLGDSATLTSSGCTGNISWSNGATSSTIKVSPVINSTYTATCIVGSCSYNQSVNIIALSTPSVTASGILQCGQAVTLTANNVPVGSSIQWRKDGVDVVGAINNTLSINNAGNYDFKVGAILSTQLQINTTSISDIRFIDLNNGYLFNANNLWKTTNGGTNWVNIYSHTSNFEDVYFIDSNNGWAITQQNILKTVNGGLNWTIYNNNWSGLTLLKTVFKDANTGIIITNDGRSISTTNGGVTWTLNTNPVESNVSSFAFKDLVYIPNTNNILLAYRSNSTILIKVIKSIDNGISWTTISFPNVSYFSGLDDISFVDSNNGWIIGYEYDKLLMKTVDGGNTWTRLNPIMNSGSYNKIDFITPQIGYIQALDYSTFNNKLYKTKDGGTTWSTFMIVDNNNDYLNTNNIKIDFLSEDNGWYTFQAPNTNQSFLKKVSTPQCSTTPKVLLNICCTTFETIKSGSWADPTTWSCNRIPTAIDDIFINTGHTITDNGNTIHAKTLNYRGGILQLSANTNFILR